MSGPIGKSVGRGPVRAGIAPVLGFVLALLVMVVGGATVAVGSEGRPIAITQFSLQTTRTVAVPGPLTHDDWGFASEPVPYVQAGGHPAGQAGGADSLTYKAEFESEQVKEPSGVMAPVPVRDPKDIVVDLPTGLLGNPTSVPRCPMRVALSFAHCPVVTQIGTAVVYISHGVGLEGPIVNVVPEAGQSAEFALENPANINFLMTAHVVRTPGGYGLTVVTNSIPQVEIYKVELSFWGVPAAKMHDPERGLYCQRQFGLEEGRPYAWSCHEKDKATGNESSGVAEVPFLTMPSDCSAGGLPVRMRADSWEEPGRVGINGKYENYVEKSFVMPGVTGCELLPFGPGVSLSPDTRLADAPVEMGVGLSVPQPETPVTLASPEMRRAVLNLPLGLSISPGIVDGVQACEEFGPEGINFTGPESEETGLNGELQLAPGHCPQASRVGSAEATTPLLDVPIKGSVYLARPGCGNPAFGQAPCTEQDALDGNLYRLYLELGGKGPLAGTGVNIKVRLKTEANPATGQLTTVADEIAQLPFSELKVDLNGGPRAALDNPSTCGRAMTTADFTPWAAPGTTPEGLFMNGIGDATPSSFYEVSGCASPSGLNPGFVAGTVTPNAGKFSAFTLNISRKDREQYIKGIQVHTPAGLLGMLSNIPLCPQAQADDPSVYGECEASKIGTTRVASGAGSHPFEIEGSIYLTGPYEGAPFGVSIVTHAVAGPFNLGLVVVRARINVDPATSELTITTDETGRFALPQIVFGVPLRLQRVTVNVDRSRFMFNPTNCDAQQITAKISGTQQAVADVSSPFAVGNCTSLAFKPLFTARTSGHTTRKTGASLYVRLSYPKGAMGRYANVKSVKVSLPKQLPSWLETLKKACLQATFDRDPAACPAGSIIGIAKARTPLLPVGLSGPVYFVSHGGEEFPSLIIVLQGDNVRVDLAGSTFIHKGITSSTFKSIPDVPVNTFELYLPQGQNHALAANGNLCKQALVMPTSFTAQNGIVIKQNTKILPTGCAKPKRAQKHKRRTLHTTGTHSHTGSKR